MSSRVTGVRDVAGSSEHEKKNVGRGGTGVLVIVCVCLLAMTCGACGDGETTSDPDRQSVTVLYIGDERIFLQEYWGMEATYLLFLPLAASIGESSGDPRPVLAERWEHSGDYREWTFFLRRDVKWHDGVPVTAHDVKFTLDLRKHPAIYGMREGRYSVDVLDEYTVRVIYDQPTDGLDMWAVYYPKHLLAGHDPDEFFEWDFWTAPIGNGPYRFVRQIPKTMVEVEANPDHFRGKPRIDRVILKFSQQPSLAELLSGNVDALTYVGRDILFSLADDDRFRSYHWWGGWLDAICWNHRSPLFHSAAVRAALTMAIDRRGLGNVLNYPESVPIMDTISTPRQFRRGSYPEPLPHDPDTSRRLLEGEGWRDDDGDGVLTREGEEFRFGLQTFAEGRNTAVFVQDQLQRIGVRMEIEILDGTVVRRRLHSGNFDAMLTRLSNATIHPNFGHLRIFGEDSPLGYAEPEMIRLLDDAEDAIDPDERDGIYEEIMPIFARDMPVTLLLPQVQTHVVHRRIKGLESLHRACPVWFMEDLWIDDDD